MAYLIMSISFCDLTIRSFANDQASVNKTVRANLPTQSIIDKQRHSIVYSKRFARFQKRSDESSAIFFFLPNADFAG